MTLWFSSDPHFGHRNMVEVFTHEGLPARTDPRTPGLRFNSVESHDEYIVERHNALVRPEDHWYCLGDVAMKAEFLPIVRRLNGHKRLVRGNHDIFKTRLYLDAGFEEIHATRQIGNLLFSHIPIAPWSFNRAVTCNVHGHTHLSTPFSYRATDSLTVKSGAVQSRLYLNVSMEWTGYAPRTLEQLQRFAKERS